ncbi:MAG TPA: SOS response-associated peptidase family protein [Devosiaceae bacterium]|nr:SOS response-associated peptidase family protein [Devosiaceae bacterium]
MCNLYSFVTNVEAFRAFVKAFDVAERLGNLQPYPGIFPDYSAPIIRNGKNGPVMAEARWGMPTPRSTLDAAARKRAEKLSAKGKAADFETLRYLEPDSGVTNIRNVSSPHWRPWLGYEHRCVVPFTSFSENEALPDGSHPPVWFALSPERPLAFFAGIYVPGWTSVRKAKTGTERADLFGFLTTEPNAEVRPIHPKAMPVILRTPEEVATWLTAPIGEALKLQRPLPDGSLVVVARGERRGDPPELAIQLAGALF